MDFIVFFYKYVFFSLKICKQNLKAKKSIFSFSSYWRKKKEKDALSFFSIENYLKMEIGTVGLGNFQKRKEGLGLGKMGYL